MSNTQRDKRAPSIGQAIGAQVPLLPGESHEEYQQGLAAAVDEMQARTPLQVYLVQKIFDCLWWIRRYEQHKISALIVQMADLITEFQPGDGLSEDQSRIVRALQSNNWDDRTLKSAMSEYKHTPETLMQSAINQASSKLLAIDQQIALRVKTLSGLQSSYEALVNRRVHAERLRLQTQLMRRDLTAIDVPAIESDSGNQNQAKP